MQPHDPYNDAWIDAQLRAVAVPDDLVDRLREQLWSSDAMIDERLRAVPLPLGMARRLRRITRRGNAFERLYRVALAATLLIALGAYYFTSAMLLWRPASSPFSALPALALRGPGEVGRDIAGQVELERARELARRRVDRRASAAATPAAPEIALVPLGHKTQIPRADADLPARWRLDGMAARGGPDPFLDAALARWPVLAAHRPFDELPELHKVPGPIPQGMHVALAPGFDLPFFIRTRVHPFVMPFDARLQSMTVPLGIGSASYDLARRYVADGELPPPETVRVEEFLAAVDYGFPRPLATSVAIHVAAGPSPFAGEAVRAAHGGQALRMVQIGVQARDVTRAKRGPASLVLAIDRSASMAWGGRLEMVGRGLLSVVDEFQPDDRLTLVAFGESADVMAEEIGREEIDSLREALARLKPAGSTNVGAGLRQAYAVATRMPATERAQRAVVLLTDGLAELDPVSKDLIAQRLKEAAERGVRLEIVDLGQPSEERNLKSQLEDFAKAGKGEVRRALDARQVAWSMREILSGKSQLVARDVRLQVSFRPGAVLQYRLLGHEAAAVAGLLPARPEADFYAGQSATALYEVWLRPKGGEEVAQVDLSWLEPGGTQRRSLTRKINRATFAPTVGVSPESLLLAAVVAETAEVLRQSPFAVLPPNAGSLARIADVVGQIDTRLRTRPAFYEFLAMLQRAQKAKPSPASRR
jgi:Ca-activated chloride channel family protein